MILIACPHCGPRNEDEFLCWSSSEPRRPADPEALDDAEWVDYVYFHDNPKGRSREARACRTAAGLYDSSPLGKFELAGADAATFLNRVLTGRVDNLAVGEGRFGWLQSARSPDRGRVCDEPTRDPVHRRPRGTGVLS